jgi:hypothetical protein
MTTLSYIIDFIVDKGDDKVLTQKEDACRCVEEEFL